LNTRTQTADKGWLDLSGRVCVLTGAAGGIGAEIAREMAAQGAQVALLDREEGAANAIASEIEKSGGRAMSVFCDITEEKSVASAAEAVARTLGPCTVLVNNAAAIYAEALMDISVDKWNQLMSVNVTGYLLCSQAFGRQMIGARGGSIVHVGSISGSFPQPYSGAYSVSKAGVKMLSQLLAVELGEHGIRSNVVSPGMVRTPMTEGIYQDPEVLRRRTELVPVRRISTPRDIAEVVLFLASDRSSYVNGHDVLVDGGLSRAWLGMIPRPGFEKKDTASGGAA
jgi:NAD(P)-dependent dehydrogenase (short-subunit alcohol dehydrogenase family)